MIAPYLLGSWSFNDLGKINEIETTDVVDDLDSCDGFNRSDYTINFDGSPKLLNFVEYYYSNNDDYADKYGLYVYIFNESLIKVDSYENAVQIGFEVSENHVSYDKYDLKLLDSSSDSLFYKFKVVDNEKTLYSKAKKYNRKYYVSGFELKDMNQVDSTDYKVGSIYSYSGYGVGLNNNKESTLSAVVEDTETLSLNVQNDYFRTESSSLGKGFKNDLFYCYFAVPNNVIKKYGYVSNIKAQWLKYQSDKFLVLDNKQIDKITEKLHNSSFTKATLYQNDNTFDSDKITKLFQDEKYFGVDDVKTDFDSKDIFLDGVKIDEKFIKTTEKKVKSFSSDDKKDILSYSSTHDGWVKFFDYFGDWWNIPKDSDLLNLPIIEKLNGSDLKTKHLNNVVGVQNYINNNINSTTYVFRYDSGTYFANPVSVGIPDTTIAYNINPILSNVGYSVSLDLIHGFDIIELTFNKDGVYYSMGIVNNPTSVFPKIDSPITDRFSWLKMLFEIVIGLFLAVLLVYVLTKLVKWIQKVYQGFKRR